MNELLNLMTHISNNVDVVLAYIATLKKPAISELQETWIDGQEVMQALHISKRTLQSLRDTGVLPFSRLNGKFYYKVEDLKQLLQSNYSTIKSKSNGDK